MIRQNNIVTGTLLAAVLGACSSEPQGSAKPLTLQLPGNTHCEDLSGQIVNGICGGDLLCRDSDGQPLDQVRCVETVEDCVDELGSVLVGAQCGEDGRCYDDGAPVEGGTCRVVVVKHCPAAPSCPDTPVCQEVDAGVDLPPDAGTPDSGNTADAGHVDDVDAGFPDALPPESCSDHYQCGQGNVCDLERNVCVACKGGRPCNDGDACTQNDACRDDGVCVGERNTAPVLAFRRVEGSATQYFYTTDAAETPAGFEKIGPLFRVAPFWADTDELLLLHSERAGDYMTSRFANEGDNFNLGYDPLLSIGPMFKTQFRGSIPLYRWYQPEPLRHYSDTAKDGAPDGFHPDLEHVRGYVCPMNGPVPPPAQEPPVQPDP